MHPRAREVAEQGYTVLPAVYDADECRQIRAILDAAFARRAAASEGGQPSMGGTFGCVFHPLLTHAPEMARFYLKDEVLDVIRLVLQVGPCPLPQPAPLPLPPPLPRSAASRLTARSPRCPARRTTSTWRTAARCSWTRHASSAAGITTTAR